MKKFFSEELWLLTNDIVLTKQIAIRLSHTSELIFIFKKKNSSRLTCTRRLPSYNCMPHKTYEYISKHQTNPIENDKIISSELHISRRRYIKKQNLLHHSTQTPQRPTHTDSCPCQAPRNLSSQILVTSKLIREYYI